MQPPSACMLVCVHVFVGVGMQSPSACMLICECDGAASELEVEAREVESSPRCPQSEVPGLMSGCADIYLLCACRVLVHA